LKADGKLVVGGLLARELIGDDDNKKHTGKVYKGVDAARRFIKVLGQAGRVRFIPKTVVDQETENVRDKCQSDDPHVIALARVSGARILCSHDTTLHKDFTDPKLIKKPRGHIYQTKAHSHLLKHYGHTRACGNGMNT